jgi:hypothetical protein
MDVQGAAGIKPRTDRGEPGDAFLVGELPAAQVRIVVGSRD